MTLFQASQVWANLQALRGGRQVEDAIDLLASGVLEGMDDDAAADTPLPAAGAVPHHQPGPSHPPPSSARPPAELQGSRDAAQGTGNAQGAAARPGTFKPFMPWLEGGAQAGRQGLDRGTTRPLPSAGAAVTTRPPQQQQQQVALVVAWYDKSCCSKHDLQAGSSIEACPTSCGNAVISRGSVLCHGHLPDHARSKTAVEGMLAKACTASMHACS